MRLLCTLLFFGFAVMSASASDIADIADIEQRRAEETGKTYKVFKTRLGWMYQDVTVTNITDAGISIIHSDGTARLGFDRLTPEQRETFGITKDGAEAMQAKEEKAQAAFEAHIAAKQKAWRERQEEQQVARQKAYEEQQKAHQALLAKQAVEGLEAQKVQPPQNETSIVSVLEVPTFPIIRGPDNQVLRPMQGYTRSDRSRPYRSNRTTIYSGGYGGTYGYPVRYNGYGGSCGSYAYPSRGGTYRPSYHRGSYGAINYRKGNFNIGLRW